MRVCVPACVRELECAGVCAFTLPWVHMCACACVRVCVYARVLARERACMQVCV